MKKLKNQNMEIKDGFRVAWFIPIEMLISGTMLGLAPKLGIGLSIIVVGIPSLLILIRISRLQSRLSAPYIAMDQLKIAQLTPQETLAFWDGDDFDYTKANWYDDRVLKEMAQELNPLPKLGKLVISSRRVFTSFVRFTSIQLSKTPFSRSTVSSSGKRSSSNHRNGLVKSIPSVL